MEIADYISVFRDGTHVITDKASAFTRASMIEKMVGREMKEVFPPRSNTIGDTLFEVKNFTKKGVFENVSFEVKKRRGVRLGISGLVGAGRTEIARAIIGLDPKDSGEVWCGGKRTGESKM